MERGFIFYFILLKNKFILFKGLGLEYQTTLIVLFNRYKKNFKDIGRYLTEIVTKSVKRVFYGFLGSLNPDRFSTKCYYGYMTVIFYLRSSFLKDYKPYIPFAVQTVFWLPCIILNISALGTRYFAEISRMIPNLSFAQTIVYYCTVAIYFAGIENTGIIHKK